LVPQVVTLDLFGRKMKLKHKKLVDDGLFVIPPSKEKIYRYTQKFLCWISVIYNWLIIQNPDRFYMHGEFKLYTTDESATEDIMFSIDTKQGTFEFFVFYEKQGENSIAGTLSILKGKII
jgi:hypothetical protein